MIRRGEVWWAELPGPAASEPGYRRPVLVVQSDEFNRIRTVVVAVLITNLRLAAAPGNLLVVADDTGLSRDSVVNVSQIITIDKTFLTGLVGEVDGRIMRLAENGIRMVLSL